MGCTNTRTKTQPTGATSKEKGWTQRAENIAFSQASPFPVFLVRIVKLDSPTWLPRANLCVNPSISDRPIDGLFQPPRPQDSIQTMFGSSSAIDHPR